MRQLVCRTFGILVLLGAGPSNAADETAADAVILRDGSVLLGQVAEVGRFGATTVVARRAWVRQNLPEQARGWERSEAERVRQAKLQRRERVAGWRRERAQGGSAGPGDPLTPWFAREIATLTSLAPPQTPLMRVVLDGVAIRSVARRDAETAKLLRAAWRIGIEDPEEVPLEDLRQTLTDREALRADDPAPIDDLLPLASETEATWRLRRAATEVSVEPAVRFVLFREFVLPESSPERENRIPATTLDLTDDPNGHEAFAVIQAVKPVDPVSTRLDEVADRGRIGAIFSRVTLSANDDTAEAESALWVQQASGSWSVALSKRAVVRLDAPIERGEPVADATPLRSLILILETVASTPSTPEASRRRQVAGYTAQRALGRTRFALDREMQPYLLPLAATRR